jgi:hypothetical protein
MKITAEKPSLPKFQKPETVSKLVKGLGESIRRPAGGLQRAKCTIPRKVLTVGWQGGKNQEERLRVLQDKGPCVQQILACP